MRNKIILLSLITLGAVLYYPIIWGPDSSYKKSEVGLIKTVPLENKRLPGVTEKELSESRKERPQEEKRLNEHRDSDEYRIKSICPVRTRKDKPVPKYESLEDIPDTILLNTIIPSFNEITGSSAVDKYVTPKGEELSTVKNCLGQEAWAAYDKRDDFEQSTLKDGSVQVIKRKILKDGTLAFWIVTGYMYDAISTYEGFWGTASLSHGYVSIEAVGEWSSCMGEGVDATQHSIFGKKIWMEPTCWWGTGGGGDGRGYRIWENEKGVLRVVGDFDIEGYDQDYDGDDMYYRHFKANMNWLNDELIVTEDVTWKCYIGDGTLGEESKSVHEYSIAIVNRKLVTRPKTKEIVPGCKSGKLVWPKER